MLKLTSVNDVELNYSLVGAIMYLMLDEEERSDGRQKRGRQAAIFRRRVTEICDKYGYGEIVDAGNLPDDINFLNEIHRLCRVYCVLHKRT